MVLAIQILNHSIQPVNAIEFAMRSSEGIVLNNRAHAARGIIQGELMKTVFAALIVLAAGVAFAHSGGTDKDGCHTNHKTGTRHCH